MKQILGLQIKQTTQLAMTTALRQAIALLQLNALELTDFLVSQAESNPFLSVDVPFESGYWPRTGSAGDEEPFLLEIPEEKTLRDFLLGQLFITCTDPLDRTIGTALIDSLEESGYLYQPIEEICAILDQPKDRVEAVLTHLKTFEPAGIFSQSIPENFTNQLKEKGLLSTALEKELQELALVLEQHGSFATHPFKFSSHTWSSLRHVIGHLHIHPADGFLENKPLTGAVPDFVLDVFENGEWHVYENAGAYPKVSVDHTAYKSVLPRTSKEEKAFCEEAYKSALWLTKALHQRARNTQRVLQTIFDYQEGFIQEGLARLRPLTLRDIAAQTDLHESTVSRIVTHKTISTPQGTFDLKIFFQSGVPQKGQEEGISAMRIKKHLKSLVEKENPIKPLSDEHLACLLKHAGLAVARRTVTKYRESLGIPTLHQRRAFYQVRQCRKGIEGRSCN